jgi:hypothetical protein
MILKNNAPQMSLIQNIEHSDDIVATKMHQIIEVAKTGL